MGSERANRKLLTCGPKLKKMMWTWMIGEPRPCVREPKGNKKPKQLFFLLDLRMSRKWRRHRVIDGGDAAVSLLGPWSRTQLLIGSSPVAPHSLHDNLCPRQRIVACTVQSAVSQSSHSINTVQDSKSKLPMATYENIDY